MNQSRENMVRESTAKTTTASLVIGTVTYRGSYIVLAHLNPENPAATRALCCLLLPLQRIPLDAELERGWAGAGVPRG